MKNLKSGKLRKIEYKLRFLMVRAAKLCSERRYMRAYLKLLRDFGMRIGAVNYIDSSSYFDNYDYSLIEIGDQTTISREVLFLTHDFSITRGLRACGIEESGKFLKGIRIGENCFIGARVTLLPGTDIGSNCIIGAGAVVKGHIPEGSVVIGNPARVVADTRQWAQSHWERKDFELHPKRVSAASTGKNTPQK